MKWPTHYACGACCGLAVSAVDGPPVEQAASLTPGSIAASTAPDMDAKLSFLHPLRHEYDHRCPPTP